MASKYFPRTPRNYDGTNLTVRLVKDLLPNVLAKIGEKHTDRPDLILAAWSEIIGSKLAPMTEAASFLNGTLLVKVKNSTLLSLLSQNDKPRVLHSLRSKFPKTEIRNIIFRLM